MRSASCVRLNAPISDPFSAPRLIAAPQSSRSRHHAGSRRLRETTRTGVSNATRCTRGSVESDGDAAVADAAAEAVLDGDAPVEDRLGGLEHAHEHLAADRHAVELDLADRRAQRDGRSRVDDAVGDGQDARPGEREPGRLAARDGHLRAGRQVGELELGSRPGARCRARRATCSAAGSVMPVQPVAAERDPAQRQRRVLAAPQPGGPSPGPDRRARSGARARRPGSSATAASPLAPPRPPAPPARPAPRPDRSRCPRTARPRTTSPASAGVSACQRAETAASAACSES